jgi:ribosomal protein S18 acetylase RimI-like enzyme
LSGETTLAAQLMRRCPALSLREESDDDRAFMADLYASTRETELAHVPWEAATKRAFLHEQHALQHAHYRANYVGAEFLVIQAQSERLGRIYLYRKEGGREIRLMDIALVPERRGQGMGSALIEALLQIAGANGWEITLHVEPNNPAMRLYDRLGFRLIENRGVYLFLGWNGAAPLDAA